VEGFTKKTPALNRFQLTGTLVELGPRGQRHSKLEIYIAKLNIKYV